MGSVSGDLCKGETLFCVMNRLKFKSLILGSFGKIERFGFSERRHENEKDRERKKEPFIVFQKNNTIFIQPTLNHMNLFDGFSVCGIEKLEQ